MRSRAWPPTHGRWPPNRRRSVIVRLGSPEILVDDAARPPRGDGSGVSVRSCVLDDLSAQGPRLQGTFACLVVLLHVMPVHGFAKREISSHLAPGSEVFCQSHNSRVLTSKAPWVVALRRIRRPRYSLPCSRPDSEAMSSRSALAKAKPSDSETCPGM